MGPIPVGFPTCADDVMAIASSSEDLQTMFNLIQHNADAEHYTLHPLKTHLISYMRHIRGYSHESQPLTLGDSEIPLTSNLTHLGITRTASQLSPDDAISKHIAGARGTLYALFGAGMHGRNGLPPLVTRAIYQAYVLSRLTYGLEVQCLKPKQLDVLEKFHRNTLRMLQSLPDRAANAACYLLIGIPPIEAIIDINIAGVLGRIANLPGSTLHEVMLRQLAVKTSSSKSWFIYATRRLARYSLPDLHSIIEHPPNPDSWRKLVKQEILRHWTLRLQEEASEKSSLKYLQIHQCDLSRPHPVWLHSADHPRQAERARIKVRLLTGCYTLQANRHRFNQFQVSSSCPVCEGVPEDRLHFIRACPAYAVARQALDDRLMLTIRGYEDMTEEQRLNVILDPSSEVSDRADLERTSSHFLFLLHGARSRTLATN